MSFSSNIKRCYAEISGTPKYSESKRHKSSFLQQELDTVDFTKPDDVKKIAEKCWSYGFITIHEGELILSDEVCIFLNLDHLQKILSLTPIEINAEVRSCVITAYLHFGPQLPGILLDLCPNLDVTCFQGCHQWLADHAFFVGEHAERFLVNKGLLGITHPCQNMLPDGLSYEVLQSLDPAVFQNCLRITEGTPPIFNEGTNLQEFLHFMKGLSYLHLEEAPQRIANLVEDYIVSFLEYQKMDIIEQDDMCAWLEQLSKLLEPYFQVGRFLHVRHYLTREFYENFCKKLNENLFERMDRPALLTEFTAVESYLSLVANELGGTAEFGDSSLRCINTFFAHEICYLIRDRLFCTKPLADDQEVQGLLELPFVQMHLRNFYGKIIAHTYKDLTPALIRNLLFLLEYLHVNGLLELEELACKMIDLLQFDVRPWDAEKAFLLSQQHPQAKLHYILMLRKRNPSDALAQLKQTLERSGDSKEREAFTLVLAYCTYKDERNLEGALEYIQRIAGPLFDHLRAYFLAHIFPRPVDEIEQLMSGTSYTKDPLTLYTAHTLGKGLPEEEITWNASHTFIAFFASEIISELPLEWQMKVFPTPELLRLFKVQIPSEFFSFQPIPSAPPLTPVDVSELSAMLLDDLSLEDY